MIKYLIDPKRYPIMANIEHGKSAPSTRIEGVWGQNYHQIFSRAIALPRDNERQKLLEMLDDVEAVIGSAQKPQQGDITCPRRMGGMKSFKGVPMEAFKLLWLREPAIVSMAKTGKAEHKMALCECTISVGYFERD